MTSMFANIKRSNPNALSVHLASKLLAGIAIVTLVMAILVVSIGHAFAAPFPRSEVMVRNADIRLGDVFDGLTQHADFVLAPAPKPGENLVWNAPTLMRIATAFNLPWRPQNNDHVIIRRAAQMVDADTMRAVIRDHLATLNDTDSFNVTLTTSVPEIIVPTLDVPRIEVSDFNMPSQGGTFNAILHIGTTGGKFETVSMRGVAERLVHIPVLKNTIKNGTVINATDITWVTQPAAAVRKNAILDEKDLIGSTPKRAIAEGSYVTPDDIQLPLLVSHGDVVTMVFKSGGMYLTAKGRALEDGAAGQTIKVSNIGTSRQIEARVTAAKEVTVQ